MSIISGINDDNLQEVVPSQGTPVVNINGVLFPIGVGGSGNNGVDVSDGDANPDEVFPGKVFYNANGRQTGTMPLAQIYDPEISFNNNNDILTVSVESTKGCIVDDASKKVKTLNISDIVPTENGGNTIIPSTSNQKISGGKFIANDIIVKGDSNLVAEYIKKGIEIFDVTGSYEATGGSGGGSTGGDGISQLVKVSEFIAPYDAYSAVESIEVSGLGERETWDGDIDFSIWNGTYVVTPETAGETSTEKRIYKHSSDSKYLYRMFCMDNQEYYWILDDSTGAENVYDSWFADSDLESGSWFCYPYDLSCAITLNKTIGTYPDQELVLKVQPATGSSISNDLRTWEFGDAMDLTKYETTPVEGAMHVLLDGELLSNKVYPTTTQGVNGLLFYAPLTSVDNDLVVGSYTASKPFEYSEYGAELESLYLLTDVPVSALQGDFTFFAEVTVHDTSHEHPIFAAYDSNYMIGLDTTGNAYSMYAGFSTWDWNILTGNNSYTPDENNVSGRGSIATTQDVTQKVAMTRNGDIWELYVNNVLSLRRNRPGTIRASGYIALHRWGSGDGSMTNAPTAMKNVKIYSRGMTAEEIAQL